MFLVEGGERSGDYRVGLREVRGYRGNGYVRRRLGDEELRRRWPGTEEGYHLLSGVLGSGHAGGGGSAKSS